MSPQWGSNSKAFTRPIWGFRSMFQSPQWGSNSKGNYHEQDQCCIQVSVPAMVDVNGTVYHLRTDICALGIGYHNFA